MERIKAYFEEAIKTDPALAEAYKPEKLEECWKYIISQAKKQAKNGCAMVEDSEVFKWARDFMYGDIPEEEKKPEPKAEATPEENNDSVVKESLTTKKPKMEDGFEVYGEYEDEAEEETEAPAETEEKPSIEEAENTVIEMPSSEIVAKTFEEVENKRTCGACGYFSGADQYPTGGCMYRHTSVQKNAAACSEYIGTPAETKPTEKAEKKSKKKQEDLYDGPSLFDDLF